MAALGPQGGVRAGGGAAPAGGVERPRCRVADGAADPAGGVAAQFLWRIRKPWAKKSSLDLVSTNGCIFIHGSVSESDPNVFLCGPPWLSFFQVLKQNLCAQLRINQRLAEESSTYATCSSIFLKATTCPPFHQFMHFSFYTSYVDELM